MGQREVEKTDRKKVCFVVTLYEGGGAKCSSCFVGECRRVSVTITPVMREVFERDYKLADVLFHHVSHLFPTC